MSDAGAPPGGAGPWPAPAKINLGLRITGRRPDGYHELDSVFLPLDLADRLELETTPGDGLSIDVTGLTQGVPADDRNLAVRAAAAYLAAAGIRARITLRLHKRIPSGAGLGGGSSDAGTVLRALDARWPGALAPKRLAALALELGADVPFFLAPRPARVGGVGEVLEPLPGVPALALLLVNPGIALSTAEVYRAWDALAGELTQGSAGSTMRPLRGLEASGGVAGLGARDRLALVANDLEPAAIRLCPVVARLRRRLEAAGALAVGLSGSGPTLYGVFRDGSEATRAAEVLGGGEDGDGGAWRRVARTMASP